MSGPPASAVAASFARLDPAETWLGATVGPAPADWLRCDRLAADATEMERLRRAIVAVFGAVDRRTDGVMMMWRYADVARAATLVFALDRRVPDLRPGAAAFDPGNDDRPMRVAYESAAFHCLPNDPAAVQPEATVVPDLDALRRHLADLVEAYLAPVIEPMMAFTRLGTRALWGIGATVPLVAIAHTLAEKGDPDGGAAEVAAILQLGGRLTTSPPALEVVEIGGGQHLLIRDGACCRAYRRPDSELCLSCPILSRADRLAGVARVTGRALPADPA